jgi:hypothetical protein
VTLTESTRRPVAEQLDAHGWDLATLRKQGRYLEYDADEAASRISLDESGDDYIAATFDAIEQRRVASNAGPDTRLTLFGDIAARLCHKGEVEAAIGLERKWNALTRQLPYLTVCAYPLDGFVEDGLRGLPAHICAQHSCVSHATA